VEGAQQSVRFLAYSFTDDRLGEVVMRQAQGGRLVLGVFETRGSESEYSEFGRLHRTQPSMDVVTDGNPYIMHHKVFILDEETVVLGSYNFTANADESNDENLLVIHDPSVAALFMEEFGRIYRQGVAGSE
jgi:phosphatidylserine/phosphatidylglycerophosphate/cardiolipin synthase-like enzyme